MDINAAVFTSLIKTLIFLRIIPGALFPFQTLQSVYPDI